MKRNIIFLVAAVFICLFLVVSCSKKQSTEPEEPSGGEIIWEKFFGGSELDEGFDVKETPDGGFIIVGYTYSFGAGGSDVYIVKTDGDGNEQWSKTYGDVYDDEAQSVVVTSDNGYVVVGTKRVSEYDTDIYILRLNTGGDTIWTRTYGSMVWDHAYDVEVTSDGNYVLAGSYTIAYNFRDVCLLKFDDNGDTLWLKTYGTSNFEYGYSVIQTSDGGYAITGYRNISGTGNYYIYILRTDSNGDTLWTKIHGDTDDDEGYEILEEPGGGFTIVGQWETDGNIDVCLLKTDDDGNEVLKRSYGGSVGDHGHSIQHTANGGYIIAGRSFSYGEGNGDIYLIRTDGNGDLAWTGTYGGSGYDCAFSICPTSDGKYVVVGYKDQRPSSSYDVWMLKVEP